ncbi:MAG TPA: penicillin-binding transpeptidase domain-containing protein, partial [Anaeromyxobacteraceae bacterium]|nr:penicillin-binding transpeptidase domain-containing protein [Anaeromyxobacteraceae bacterium]
MKKKPHLLAAAAVAAAGAVALTATGLARAESPAPVALPILRPAPPEPVLSEMRLDRSLGRYVAPYGKGKAILTLEPGLQVRLEGSLARWTVPWGATVLLEPRTGRVIAMAEHAETDPGLRGGVLRARPPAASIFKIVTAAALLESGVDPQEAICYHGG